MLERWAGIGVGFGALCWFLLWAGINTGPGNLDLDYITASLTGAFNGVRAAFPLAMLAAWLFYRLVNERVRRRKLTTPEALWLWYGAVCMLSSLYARPWFDFGYWGLAYLGTFAALDVHMRGGRALYRAGELNRLTWLLCSAVLAAVAFVARGQLLVHTSMGLSGYTINDRIQTVAGMPMVRSSGVSRMAAVPAIIAFVALWQSRGYARLAAAAVFVPCFYLVWAMQSRGSLFSLAFALAMVMILLKGRARIAGWSLLGLTALVLASGFVPSHTVHYIYMWATRGTQGRELASMSGRTHIFHEAWKKIVESPLIGYGPQADRQFPMEIGNAQNGALYALLCGGFIGAAGYVGGLAVSWAMLIHALAWRGRLSARERTTLLQVAGIMAFFTLRSYPENCAALYSVDLLVQLPAVVYIGELDRALRRAKVIRRMRAATAPWRPTELPRAAGASY